MPPRSEQRVFLKEACCRGFTLLEIIVAIAVGSIVLAIAESSVNAIATSSRRLDGEIHRRDRAANSEALLRSLVYQASVNDAEDSGLFAGDESSARFATWCAEPGGWIARCRVTLILERTDSGEALVLEGATPRSITVRARAHEGVIRYLGSASTGGHWLEGWQSTSTLPLALGVVLDRDTLILRVGARE